MNSADFFRGGLATLGFIFFFFNFENLSVHLVAIILNFPNLWILDGFEGTYGHFPSKYHFFRHPVYIFFCIFFVFFCRDKPLVVQYAIQLKKKLNCAGGFIKLFDCNLDQNNLFGGSPYLLQFGPNKCGSNKEITANLFHEGKKYEIQQSTVEPLDDGNTHFYTFIIHPNSSYDILIDGKSVLNGSLTSGWNVYGGYSIIALLMMLFVLLLTDVIS